MTRAIIFINGNLSDFSQVKKYITADTDIICADGGANFAVENNMTPSIVIGDLDSIEEDVRRTLELQHVTFIPYPRDKDYTDSELAITYALEKKYEEIIITGIMGDRFDHMMANCMYIANLKQDTQNSTKISIINGNQEMYIIKENSIFHGEKNDTLSLIPLDNNCKGITTHHLQYPLYEESLPFGSTRGISNVFMKDTAEIELQAGILLVVHTKNP